MESIPEGLDFPNASMGNPSTSQAWLGLLAGAHSSLDIASFYWTLTNNDTRTQEPSAQQVPGWWEARGEGKVFPGSPRGRGAGLTPHAGLGCLEAAIFTRLSGPGAFCHGHREASECQGVGLVTGD